MLGHFWVLLVVVVGNLVFWGGLIALIVLAYRRFGRRSPADDALRILNERFARGEIDQQEYEQRKAILSKSL